MSWIRKLIDLYSRSPWPVKLLVHLLFWALLLRFLYMDPVVLGEMRVGR